MSALRKHIIIKSNKAEASLSQTFVQNNEQVRDKINKLCKEFIKSRVDHPGGSSETLTRRLIAEKVSIKYPKFSHGIVRPIIDQIIEEIINTLITGRNVDLKNFGSFSVRPKKARPGRNLMTNEYKEVSARRVVTFKASKYMRFAVQGKKLLNAPHLSKSQPNVASNVKTKKIVREEQNYKPLPHRDKS